MLSGSTLVQMIPYPALQIASFPSVSLLLITLGIVGLWRWGLWLFRTVVAILFYDPVEDDLPEDLDVSVVIPVYQEDVEAFTEALQSYAQTDPAEIVAVIDSSDTACIDAFERFAAENDNANLIVTDVPGKRAALRRGAREASGDILALVDSDVRWRPDTKREFLKPFADPDVGGVAPKQVVAEQQTLAQRLYEAAQRVRFATDMPALSVTAKALSVISGRTAVYRREAVIHVLENIETETFRKQTVISGEDKFITRGVHEAGWNTRYQSTSVIDIGSARSIGTLFWQTVRWRRNSIRSDLRSLSSWWVYDRPTLAYFMADRFVSPFAALLAPLYLVKLLLGGFGVIPVDPGVDVWLLTGLVVVWWLISRSVKLFPYLRARKRVDMVPPYILWTFAMIPVQIFGMLTATVQGWLTRGEDSRYSVPTKRNRRISALASLTVALVILVYVYVVTVVA